MKIAFISNQGNNAFRLAKWLQEFNIDAHVYAVSENNQRSNPASLSSEYETKLPEWFHQIELKNYFSFIKKIKEFDYIEKHFDIIITTGDYGLLLSTKFKRKDIIHYNLGAELHHLPFWTKNERKNLLVKLIEISWLRIALRRIYKIIIIEKNGVKVAKKLSILNKSYVFGFPEDINNINNRDEGLYHELDQKYKKYDRVFVYLSRIKYKNKNITAYKAPEKFIEAMDKLILNYPNANIKVIMAEHGDDAIDFKNEVKNKQIFNKIDWVPHLPYNQLLSYLSLKNAVIIGSLSDTAACLGGMTREALSVGAIVLQKLDPILTKLTYNSDDPGYNPKTDNEIYTFLEELYKMDSTELREKQQQSVIWAKKYLDYHAMIPVFIEMIKKDLMINQLAK